MTVAVELSVIVVTHDARDVALDTLRSARSNTGGVAIEWLVVDSGSTDGTPEAIEAAFEDVVVLRRENIGFAAANNVALARATGRHVLLLNPDVIITAGTFAELVSALDARPAVGAASVVQTAPDGSILPSIRRYPTPGRKLGEAVFAHRIPALANWQEAVHDLAAYRQERSADWLVGAFLAVRREVVEAVGGLDERFFLYSEEVDWCYRIRQAGWELRHLPVMSVVHLSGSTDTPRLTAQMEYSRMLFARKHLGAWRARAFLAGAFIGHVLRVLVLPAFAVARPRLRRRLWGEIWALAVLLHIAAPPLKPPAPVAEGRQDGAERRPAGNSSRRERAGVRHERKHGIGSPARSGAHSFRSTGVERYAARLARRAARLTGHELVRRAYYTPIPIDVSGEVWDRESEMAGIAIDYDAQLRLIDHLAPHVAGWRPPDGRNMYGAIDAQALYAMLRHLQPRRVVELGSGVSTTVIQQALGRAHEVFDPIANDRTSGAVQRLPATAVPLHVFESLEANDVLFVDTSHTVKTGGDVNHIVLDVLPRLRPGVVVHFHDVFLPYEYPREWVEDKRLYWAEQYLLQAFLIGNREWRVVLALNALAHRHADRLAAAFGAPDPVRTRPGAFWLQRVD